MKNFMSGIISCILDIQFLRSIKAHHTPIFISYTLITKTYGFNFFFVVNLIKFVADASTIIESGDFLLPPFNF